MLQLAHVILNKYGLLSDEECVKVITIAEESIIVRKYD